MILKFGLKDLSRTGPTKILSQSTQLLGLDSNPPWDFYNLLFSLPIMFLILTTQAAINLS